MNKHKLFRGMAAAALAAALAFGSPALPETITGLSGLVFDAEAASSDFTIDKSGTITGYKGKGGKVTIPSKINGITVKKIGDFAFGGSTNPIAEKITSITIPDTVTAIGAGAFSHTKLTKITIPDSVKSIGGSCFSRCYKLSSVKLSKNIKTISGWTFAYCVNLKKITIPSSVTELGEDAFYYSGLTEITIPDSVYKICTECFEYCTKLKKISLGKKLNSIEGLVFEGCKSLETIHIPEKVEHIAESGRFGEGQGLGKEMLSLKEITVDKNNESFTSIDGVLMSKTRMLDPIDDDEYEEHQERYEYEIIQIPLCINKKTYKIPENVTSIRMYSYSNYVGPSIYYDNVTDSYNEKEKEKDENEKYKRCKIKDLTIPGSVKTINSSTFQMTSLVNVTLGEGVKTIGWSAFDGCKYLKTVKLPSTLTKIERSAFYDCESLTSITLPDNLTSIDSHAFTGCKNLKTITIPKNIKSVSKIAFNECPNLKIKYKGKTYTPEAFAKLSICN